MDTDVLIWILRGNKNITQRIFELSEKAPLTLSVVSIAEIYKNIFPAELTTTEDFLAGHFTFTVDVKIAKTAGLYWQQYSKQLKKLSLADCLVAATANINNLTLVSLNLEHFPMKDIKTLDPSK
ncbi:MAG: putative ribonuclease VapC [Candidatus Woesebacteria bacterium GW2011_GWB1_38_5b]|uniref:Putative ribonuclease VapC n=1 Tax=Candidatus Woesebacteria bacterium GW2011_GWB1_38_5b TaxID=1618569 RepID=A0A0G0MKF0_9BACT|nr:MAG: putative ribonuclease VapC [Candidatus Woesebacteria bacterium GW2011_GWB1_38_5b]